MPFTFRQTAGAALAFGILSASGCKDLAGSAPLPAGLSDPSIVTNAAGAIALSVGVRAEFESAVSTYIPASGLLTDELQAESRGPATVNGALPEADIQIDARILSQDNDWNSTTFAGPTDPVYRALQSARSFASEAISALNKYAPDSLLQRAQMYTVEGYSELMLADFFCSGVPLSTLDFNGDYTYRAGATTSDVYQHAITMFDTAQSLATAADGSPILNLARVGQGRALLQLGRWSEAAQAVATVPHAFVYADTLPTNVPPVLDPSVFYVTYLDVYSRSVGDREGISGLPYMTSGDPRTEAASVGPSPAGGNTVYNPGKYLPRGKPAFVPIASGLEAQLITAEAALQANDPGTWLSILNTLRQDSTLTSTLPTIIDPGTPHARVDTMFSERAAWLFLTGQRQGDLRRLVQRYGRDKGQVYPHGAYPGLPGYGTFIDAAIPRSELSNPFFHGCLSRG